MAGLESHDPHWRPKFDRHYARLQRLWAKDGVPTSDDVALMRNLAGAACLAIDASWETPAEYIRVHSWGALVKADQLGIWAWVPRVADDADLDTTKAAVALLHNYVNAVERERNTRRHHRAAGLKPDYLTWTRARSMLTRSIVLAMIRYRITRLWRSIPTPL